MIEFGQPSTKRAIKFANQATGQEMLVEVHDKYPQMQDIHIEGRRYVEVSVEMFIELLRSSGWAPVAPGASTPVDDESDGDEKRA